MPFPHKLHIPVLQVQCRKAVQHDDVDQLRMLCLSEGGQQMLQEHLRLVLEGAVFYGATQCVDFLIKHMKPEDFHKELSNAVQYKHTECVKLLIPVSDPKANNNQALRWAVGNNHHAIFELLCEVSNLEEALQKLQRLTQPPTNENMQQLIFRVETRAKAEEEQHILNQEINAGGRGLRSIKKI